MNLLSKIFFILTLITSANAFAAKDFLGPVPRILSTSTNMISVFPPLLEDSCIECDKNRFVEGDPQLTADLEFHMNAIFGKGWRTRPSAKSIDNDN